MGIYDFKALTADEQAKLTWEDGVFLMHRETKNIKYILFQLEGIYVEFHYNNKANKITRIKSFINPDLLDPYFAG